MQVREGNPIRTMARLTLQTKRGTYSASRMTGTLSGGGVTGSFAINKPGGDQRFTLPACDRFPRAAALLVPLARIEARS